MGLALEEEKIWQGYPWSNDQPSNRSNKVYICRLCLAQPSHETTDDGPAIHGGYAAHEASQDADECCQLRCAAQPATLGLQHDGRREPCHPGPVRPVVSCVRGPQQRHIPPSREARAPPAVRGRGQPQDRSQGTLVGWPIS